MRSIEPCNHLCRLSQNKHTLSFNHPQTTHYTTPYTTERRDQILLNERCLLKGWTPLHYAAFEGSPSAVSTLLAAGASVSVHGAVLDGIDGPPVNGNGGTVRDGRGGGGAEAGTALQLARALLSKEGAGPRKKGLQEVARQLSAATQAVERAKEQRERKEREAKVLLQSISETRLGVYVEEFLREREREREGV